MEGAVLQGVSKADVVAPVAPLGAGQVRTQRSYNRFVLWSAVATARAALLPALLELCPSLSMRRPA